MKIILKVVYILNNVGFLPLIVVMGVVVEVEIKK